METVACDFCGGSEFEHVASQTDILHKTTAEIFSIVKCKGCGLQFVNPRLTREEIGRYYSDNYSFHGAPNWFRRAASFSLSVLANSSFY